MRTAALASGQATSVFLSVVKPRPSFCQWSSHVCLFASGQATSVFLPVVKPRPSSSQWSNHVRPLPSGQATSVFLPVVKPRPVSDDSSLANSQNTSVLSPVVKRLFLLPLVKTRPSFTQWSNHGRPLPSGQTTSVLLPVVKPRPCSENHAYPCRTVPLCQWSNHDCLCHGECVSCQWSNRVRVRRIVPLSCGQTTSVS